MELFFYVMVFIYGILTGSFINVCIYRIPKKENIIMTRSHCMHCGYPLKWYDLVPVFSYMVLRGRCRMCRTKIPLQYPIVEVLNGILWLAVFYFNGISISSVLYCALTSALLVLSVIDYRTFEIPIGINIFIFLIGIVRVISDYYNWYHYIIGMIAVSAFLLLVYALTKGGGIGGGDIKLMAAAGLILGWQLIILSFLLGCVIGSVIHLIRMKVSHAEHVLAMGPYLAAGIYIAVLFGNSMIQWYIAVCVG